MPKIEKFTHITLYTPDEKEKTIEFDLTSGECNRLVKKYGDPLEEAIEKALREGLEIAKREAVQ